MMHNAYETAAKQTGWETQKKSRVTWEELPEENKATMRIAVGALVDFLSERLMHHNVKPVGEGSDQSA
jgi:plastocyanin